MLSGGGSVHPADQHCGRTERSAAVDGGQPSDRGRAPSGEDASLSHQYFGMDKPTRLVTTFTTSVTFLYRKLCKVLDIGQISISQIGLRLLEHEQKNVLF